MSKTFFKIDGMDKLKKDIVKLGKIPQGDVSSSAKKGMNIALRDARANAPVDEGYLKKGIVLKAERSRTKGKKVYRAVFDDKINDIFQKKNKKGEVVAYYPVSQEYGYFAKNGRYIPGYRFMHNALNNNTKQMKDVVVSTMIKKLDKRIREVGLK